MLGDLLITAVVLAILIVGLDLMVKFLIARFLVNKTKTKVKAIASFRLADWHLKRYNKLMGKRRNKRRGSV